MNLESSISRIETSIFLNVAALEELLHAFDDIFGSNGRARHTVIIDRTLGSIVRDVTELIRQISGTGRGKKLKISGMKYSRSPQAMRNKKQNRKQQAAHHVESSRTTLEMLDHVISRKNDLKLWHSFRVWKEMVFCHNQKKSDGAVRHRGRPTSDLGEHILQSPTEEPDYWGDEDGSANGCVVYERVSAGRHDITGMLKSPKKEANSSQIQDLHPREYIDDDEETYLSNWLQHTQEGMIHTSLSAQRGGGVVSPLGSDTQGHNEAAHRSDQYARRSERRDTGGEIRRGSGTLMDMFGSVNEALQDSMAKRDFDRAGCYEGDSSAYPDYPDLSSHSTDYIPTASSINPLIFDPSMSYEPPVEEIVHDTSYGSRDVADINDDDRKYDDYYDPAEFSMSHRTVDATTDTSQDGVIMEVSSVGGREQQQEQNWQPVKYIESNEAHDGPHRRMSTREFLANESEADQPMTGNQMLDDVGGVTCFVEFQHATAEPYARNATEADCSQSANTVRGISLASAVNAPSAASTTSATEPVVPKTGTNGSLLSDAGTFVQISQAKRAQRRGTYVAGGSSATNASHSQYDSKCLDDGAVYYRRSRPVREDGNQVDLELFAYAKSSKQADPPSSTYFGDEDIGSAVSGGAPTTAALAAAVIAAGTAAAGDEIPVTRRDSDCVASEAPDSVKPIVGVGEQVLGLRSLSSLAADVISENPSEDDRDEDEEEKRGDIGYSATAVPDVRFSHHTGNHGEFGPAAAITRSVRSGVSVYGEEGSVSGRAPDNICRNTYTANHVVITNGDHSTRISDSEKPLEHMRACTQETSHSAVSEPTPPKPAVPTYSTQDAESYLSLPLSALRSELSVGHDTLPKHRRQSMSAMPSATSGGARRSSDHSAADYLRLHSHQLSTPSVPCTSQSALSDIAAVKSRTVEKPPLPVRRASVMVSRVKIDAPLPPPRTTALSPLLDSESGGGSGQSTPSRRRTPPPPPPAPRNC